MGHFVVFPDHSGNFTNTNYMTPRTKQRLELFANGRVPEFYNEKLQEAHHIHFPAEGQHRILHHFYGKSRKMIVRLTA